MKKQILQQKRLQDRGEQSIQMESGENETLAIYMKAKARQITRYDQVSTRTKHFEIVGKALDKWENGKELYAICPKPTKKMLRIDKGLCKVASALIVQIKTEKLALRNSCFPERYQALTHQNAPVGKGCNPQNICWSNAVYTLERGI